MLFSPVMLAFLTLLTIGGIAGQCLTGNDNPSVMSQESKKGLTDGRFLFALDSLRKTAAIESRGNVFFSPHSLHQALTLAYLGARGTTETNLKKALRVPDELSKIDVQRYYLFEKIIAEQHNLRLNGSSNYEYQCANRLWISNSKKLRDCVFDFFGDELMKTDFKSDPTAVRLHINNWVSNVTMGNIKDLLPEDSITENTDLVLANAVFFKGLWQNKFDPANTTEDAFYITGSKSSVVKFMKQKTTFNHVVSEELGAHILELPYKGEEVSMYVLLPPFTTLRSADSSQTAGEHDGVRTLVERLNTEQGLTELRELLDYGMPPREVDVSFPRFEMEKELPVGQLLSAMGAGELLSPNAADLRGFVADGEKSPQLGDAVHRAKIQLTEEGTTASAATALFSFRSSRPSEPAVFKANHPFVYFIYDKPMRTVLFAGIYRDPGTVAPEYATQAPA